MASEGLLWIGQMEMRPLPIAVLTLRGTVHN